MWPNQVSNPGTLALESDSLPTATRLNVPVMCIVAENQLLNGVAIAIYKSEHVCHLRGHNSAVMT